MTHRPFTLITTLCLAGLAVFLGILQSVLGATPARALSADGHGPGYLSSDGFWLGAYHFDDGAVGFCLNPGKRAPVGLEYSYADPAGMGWWTPEQSAVFAYIARSWAGSGDRLTAAAGQLATWMYAGMSEADAQVHAGRAGADTDAVYARALDMVAEATTRGSTGVRAAVVIELAENGPGRVRVELTVDRLSGPDLLGAGAHPVSVTLTGATFDDGTAIATIPSGTDVAIHPTGTEASVASSATATTGNLPYGDRLTVALPTVDAQAVLIAQPSSATAHAEATVTGPSPLPFQPRVETQTSAAVAHPGTPVTDRLAVTVDDGDGLLPTWGVTSSGEGLVPITAVVESTLHGPFADPIAREETVPDGAPTVCTVETTVTGIGEYTTPSCDLPVDGYYVWTERIDPSRTDPSAGGTRLRSWTSAFGIASEITVVQAPGAMGTTPAASLDVVDAHPAPTTAQLADTGTDILAPTLWGTGASVSGAALLVAGRLRMSRGGRRHGRRSARSGVLTGLDGTSGAGRPARHSGRRLSGRRLSGPRRGRSTWV